MRTLFVASIALLVPTLSGCVVGQIRDDLAATRAGVERLEALTPALERTSVALEQSNRQLALLHAELTEARRALEGVPPRLDEANTHLKLSTEQLASSRPMMASLQKLDESLVALRKMVENIDHAIPLLSFTKGAAPTAGAEEAGTKGSTSP